MAALGSQSIASSYEQLLHVDRDGGGNTTNLVDIKDGDNETTFALQLATDKIQVNGDATITSATGDRPVLTIENTNADNSPPSIHLYKNSSGVANNDQMGDISWFANDDGGTKTRSAMIRAIQTDVSASSDDSKLGFFTQKAGAETETMTLVSGAVGIGLSAPTVPLHIKGANDSYVQLWNNHSDVNIGGVYNNSGHGLLQVKNSSGATKVNLNANGDTYFTGGNYGIGTSSPANPLAVNRSDDGVIVDFESADAVEGTVSISGATTSYNAFIGSHYTQLKDGQNDLPVGAVVISTGEIITCNLVTEAVEAVEEVKAKDAIYETVTKQRQKVIVTEVEEEQTSLEIVEEGGKYIQKTTTKMVTKEVSTPQYEEVKLHNEDGEEIGTHKIQVMEEYEEKQLVSEAVEAVEAIESVEATIKNCSDKEYFTYIDTTKTESDPTVYGTWMGKMSDNAKGHSFGDDDKPIYLVAQVGLFKIRVTDTNGNIAKGDYLESSTRAMEGQKQTSKARVNSTISKSMIDVDWSLIDVDSELGYKWKLIPCTF